jgi:AbrB family looped-hinge helix DNA binding protein
MNDAVTVDKAGRIVLPKPLRDRLHLGPGDTLEIKVEGEQVTLTPRRAIPPLQKERGVWVFRSGEPLSEAETLETLRKIRERSERHNPEDAQ